MHTSFPFNTIVGKSALKISLFKIYFEECKVNSSEALLNTIVIFLTMGVNWVHELFDHKTSFGGE